jgi:hypothetical protein
MFKEYPGGIESLETNDYLLVDSEGNIQGISGNSDFDDADDSMDTFLDSETYIILKVVQLHIKKEID